jgi:hypothetical protein
MQMQHPSLALVALLGVGCPRVDPLPGLDGVRGSEGALLWADGPLPEGAVLERRAGGGWERVEGTGPWWDTGAAEGFSYRLASERLQGAAFEPPTLGVSLLSPQAGRMLWEGDSVALTSLWDLPGAVEGLHLALVRERAGVRAWLDGACVAGDTATADTAAIADVEACWTDAPAATFAPDAVTPS